GGGGGAGGGGRDGRRRTTVPGAGVAVPRPEARGRARGRRRHGGDDRAAAAAPGPAHRRDRLRRQRGPRRVRALPAAGQRRAGGQGVKCVSTLLVSRTAAVLGSNRTACQCASKPTNARSFGAGSA